MRKAARKGAAKRTSRKATRTSARSATGSTAKKPARAKGRAKASRAPVSKTVKAARKPASKMPRGTTAPLGVATHATPSAKSKQAGADLPGYGGIGSAAVLKATGKGWDEWLEILDGAGARDMDHKGIVAYIASRGNVGPWWQQMLTVGYEQARGLRQVHEKTDGFSMNRSKTIGVPISELFEAWNDERVRSSWLAADIVVRKATRDKSMRISWEDGATNVEVNFWNKGASKSQVAVEHNKLASAKDVARFKEFWGKALDRLQARLEAAS